MKTIYVGKNLENVLNKTNHHYLVRKQLLSCIEIIS